MAPIPGKNRHKVCFRAGEGPEAEAEELATGKMRWPGDEVPPPSALAERERDRLGKRLLGGF
jgi:hypothetical protein